MNEKETTKKEWKYDAFISYRHLEPDAFVAGSLHKILEAYKAPSNLIKERGNELKRTRIKKVFRDAEELPLTSNLNETIMYALENSEYLIAICSPRFRESMWCRKEVDTFIKLHGKEHVLTVLVDGEPSESFPEELLYNEIEVKKEDGTVEIIREPMEPLAANARAATDKERLKLLKTESLRLMAPMFGCSFDDLKQRHREQKMKRTIRLVTLAASVCFAFGIVSTGLALQISHQNAQITEQNIQITEQNNRIVEQSKEIDRQYKEALINQADAVAENARNLYEDGNRVEAIKTAMEVFPKNGEDKPYLPKVEYVLADALNLYESGVNMKAERILECDSIVANIQISPQGTKLLSVDDSGELVVWDTVTGERLEVLSLNTMIHSTKEYAFTDEENFYVIIDKQLAHYNIPTREMKVVDEEAVGYDTVSYSGDKDRLLIAGYNGAKLYEASTGNLVAKIAPEDEEVLKVCGVEKVLLCNYSSRISTGADDYFQLVFEKSADSDELYDVVVDAKDGRIIGMIPITTDTVGAVRCYGNRVYFSENHYGTTKETKFNSGEFVSIVHAYEIKDSQLVPMWKYTYEKGQNSDIVETMGGQGTRLALQFYDEIVTLNISDGSLLNRYREGCQIINTNGYGTADLFSYFTREGTFSQISSSNGEALRSDFFKTNGSNIKLFAPGGCSVTVPFSSNLITLYRYAEAPNMELQENFENAYEPVDDMDEEKKAILEEMGIEKTFVHGMIYDPQKKYMAVVYNNHHLEFFRVDAQGKPVESCGTLTSIRSVTYVDYMEFSPDGEYMVLVACGEAFLFRTEGMDLETSFPTSDQIVAHIWSFRNVDFENKCIYVSEYNDVKKIPIYTREEIVQYAMEQIR